MAHQRSCCGSWKNSPPSVHVDVVDSVAGGEAKDLVGQLRFRTPARAIGKEPRRGIGEGAFDTVIQFFDQVVVRPRAVGGNAPHVPAVEHPAPLVVEGKAVRPRLDRQVAIGDICQAHGHGMAKIVVREEEEIRIAMVAGAGLGVHGNTEQVARALEQEVIVRAAAGKLSFPFHHPATKEAVSLPAHPGSL
jgi:hypothetical protein